MDELEALVAEHRRLVAEVRCLLAQVSARLQRLAEQTEGSGAPHDESPDAEGSEQQ